jgi:hypothetical protein
MAGRPGRLRYAQRGQALIMAVLVMFILAGLAGVFIAMINEAMVESVRAVERATLEKVLQAGLHKAQTELLYSAEGADWRPDQGPDGENPGWVAYSGAFYNVNISYGGTDEITVLQQNSPLDRLLRIEVEARFTLDNPPDPDLQFSDDATYVQYRRGFLSGKRFLTRHLVAYMPIGLTDHLLWITNLDGSTEPAVLGSDLLLRDPLDPTKGITTVDLDYLNGNPTDEQLNDPNNQIQLPPELAYLPVWEGPIRSEVDLKLGNVRIDLRQDSQTSGPSNYWDKYRVFRRDIMQVAGVVSGYDVASASCRVLLINNHDETILTPELVERSLDPCDPTGTEPNSNLILTYLQSRDNNPLIRPMRAPRIDARHPVTGLDRYRALTRDSGFWVEAYNTGHLGWGAGIYIDNPEHRQHNGDLDALRAEWLNTSAENWEMGVYRPERRHAVEIILHDWGYANNSASSLTLPYIELRRPAGENFYDAENQPVGDTMRMPYPRNGVIYAEGNVIVKGTLPASLAYERDDSGELMPLYDPGYDNALSQRPGGYVGWATADDESGHHIEYYVSPENRRYDLTIVSGGTVYLEGNLLSPASRKNHYVSNRQTGETTAIDSGSVYDSKLALMAMDCVCLNPTKFFDTEVPPDTNTAQSDSYYRSNGSQQIRLTFSLAGEVDQNTRILLRHAGEAGLFNPLYCTVRMRVNGELYPWDPTSINPYDFYFCDPTFYATLTGITNNQWSPAFFDPNWLLQLWGVGSGRPNLLGNGAQNVIELEWVGGNTDYLLSAGGPQFGGGFLVTPADVQIDALLYAQRGNWFIIPGRFYNESTDPQLQNIDWPLPKYKEPLDIRIIVNGAIVENRPAPPDAQRQWMERWRGSNLNYFHHTITKDGADWSDMWDPGEADPPHEWNAAAWRWPKRRMGIQYHYDATLMRPACFTVNSVNVDQLRYDYRPRLPKLPVSPDVLSFGKVTNL